MYHDTLHRISGAFTMIRELVHRTPRLVPLGDGCGQNNRRRVTGIRQLEVRNLNKFTPRNLLGRPIKRVKLRSVVIISTIGGDELCPYAL